MARRPKFLAPRRLAPAGVVTQPRAVAMGVVAAKSEVSPQHALPLATRTVCPRACAHRSGPMTASGVHGTVSPDGELRSSGGSVTWIRPPSAPRGG